MQSLPSIRQSLFVNSFENNQTRNEKVDTKAHQQSEQSDQKKVIQGQVIRKGEAQSFTQADDIFERANYYDSLPSSTKEGLKAYTSIDNEIKRDQIKQMMGIDLYA